MHRTFANWIAPLAATLTISAATVCGSPAIAQDCISGDCGGSIVGGEIVGGEIIEGEYTGDSYVGDIDAGTAIASGQRRQFGQPDLFYNYYTQGFANMANAQMYLSPGPIPPNVGHTFYTYQPFYPHHMLYTHKDRYHNYYDGGRGMNRTRATYYSPPVRTAAKNLYWNYLRIPR